MSAAKPSLMTVRGEPGPPTLAEAARQLGLPTGALDAAFGVVLVDPEQKLYCVEAVVDADQPTRGEEGREAFRGPYSNPEIAPFRPTEDAAGAETADPRGIPDPKAE